MRRTIGKVLCILGIVPLASGGLLWLAVEGRCDEWDGLGEMLAVMFTGVALIPPIIGALLLRRFDDARDLRRFAWISVAIAVAGMLLGTDCL